MTLPKVSAGQDNPLRMAKHINAVADAVNYFQQIQLGKGQPARLSPRDTNTVLVKNISGNDLLRGHVVQLGDYAFSTIDPNNLWFDGDEPADPIEHIAILRQPVPSGDGNYWLAQMTGVCSAHVLVNDSAHRFARAVDGDHLLESARSGPIRILSEAPISSGELVVRLGVGTSAYGAWWDTAHTSVSLTASTTQKLDILTSQFNAWSTLTPQGVTLDTTNKLIEINVPGIYECVAKFRMSLSSYLSALNLLVGWVHNTSSNINQSAADQIIPPDDSNTSPFAHQPLVYVHDMFECEAGDQLWLHCNPSSNITLTAERLFVCVKKIAD